jgi:hypothetical protein
MNALDRLGDANADLVEQAIELLAELDDRLFLADPTDCSRSGIGAQLRHTADFYRSLLDGLEARRVDYDARKRDPLFEQSRAYATRELASLAERLRELGAAGEDVRLQVRSEAAVFSPADAAWTRSSLRRELVALCSHTVHHFALVRELLRARGFDPGPGFGLAASTRAHQARACAR